MTNYLTIKQAIELTKKSDSTIRRAIRKAEQNGEKVTVRDKNQLLISKDWINKAFDVQRCDNRIGAWICFGIREV